MASAMVASGFWNHKERLNAWPTYTQTNTCKVTVDRDIIKDTVDHLSLVYPKLRQTELWSELAIIKRIIYKNGNQHRKQFYFQGLRRVVKNLERLQEIGICYKLVDVRNSLVSLHKNQLVSDILPSYPSFALIVNMLGCLTGAAQIVLQVVTFCQETFKLSCSELVAGYFITFHLTLVSSLSRVWVLLKDLMHAVVECYDVIFPWLDLLEDTKKTETSDAKDLPKSLKTWLEPLKNEELNKMLNSGSVTPSGKSLTPGTLDKLFASTPGQRPEDTPSSVLPANALSLTQPSYDLGESVVSDDIRRPLKPSDGIVSEETSNIRTKLFPESPENQHDATINHTPTKKRKATEVMDSEGLSSPTRKVLAELKRFLSKGGVCRHFCSTIRIFSNKTWKNSVEKRMRKKLAKQQMKKKQRKQEADMDNAVTKKRKRGILSRGEERTKKKRKANDEEETQAKKKRKKDTRPQNEGSAEKKQKVKSGKGEKIAKKKRKDERRRKRRRKRRSCKNETQRKPNHDGEKTKAKRDIQVGTFESKLNATKSKVDVADTKKRKQGSSSNLTDKRKKGKVADTRNNSKQGNSSNSTGKKKKRKVKSCNNEISTQVEGKRIPGEDITNSNRNITLRSCNETNTKKENQVTSCSLEPGTNKNETTTRKERKRQQRNQNKKWFMIRQRKKERKLMTELKQLKGIK